MSEINLKWRKFRRNEIESAGNKFATREIYQVSCDAIRPNRAQPRADFDEDSLIKLADSIRRYGVIQPLTIRKADVDDYYDYELIAGERRLRASRLAGLFSVPCIILEADEKISAELAIIENLLRKDLNMFEVAYGLRNLIEDHKITQDELAKRMSMSQSALANKIRLLRLNYEEQRLILECNLSERHARALLRLSTTEDRISTIARIAEKSLTAEETDEYIDFLLSSPAEISASPRDDEAFAEFISDRSASSIIRGLKKRLDTLNRNGREASMEVITKKNSIELKVKISK